MYGYSSGTDSTYNVGRTNKSGGAGCASCHGTQNANTTSISGPNTLAASAFATYTITVNYTTVSALNVGIDVASGDNTLTAIDASTQLYLNEITHKAPLRQISSNAAAYTFRFTMPPAATCCAAHTLYGVAAVSRPVAWAHAQNFNVYVPPNAPSTITAGTPTPSSVPLSWTASNGGEYRVLYKVGSAPTSTTDGTLIYQGTNTSATATGLSASTLYGFAVFGKVPVDPAYSTTAATTTSVTAAAVDPNPWVDANAGNDTTNTGTSASPYKTIKKALTAVGPGGTIHVRPGTYNSALGETFPITVPSGITLQGTAAAASTIVDATGANTRVLYLSGNNIATTIEALTITGGLHTETGNGNGSGGGILAENGDQTTIKRCIITGNEVRGTPGNTGTHPSGGEAYGGGICMLSSTTRVINSVISNNIVRGGNGVSYLGTNGSGGTAGNAHGGGVWAGGSAVTLTSNTFYGNQAIGGNGGSATQSTYVGGSGGIGFYGAIEAQQGTAVNNIFANNVTSAGTPGSGAAGNGSNGNAIGSVNVSTLSYNLFFNNAGGTGDGTGTNAVVGQDPLFVGAPTDLHVRSASPARNAGQSGQVSVDLDNATRAFNPTIGAYEMTLFPTAWPGIGKIVVTWQPVSGATSYNLYYQTANGVSTSSPKLANVTSPYILKPLPNNQIYFFAMTAVENGVEGPISPQVNATTSNGSWVQGALTSGGGGFTNLARDLADGSTLYATATDGVGLYKSINAGDTWTPLPGPFSGTAMRAVAANGTTVLVAGAGSIYRSTNGGGNWTAVVTGAGIGEDFIASLVIDPLATNLVYAGDFHINGSSTASQLIAKSSDGGATFTNLLDASANNLRAYFLAVNGTLYAAGSGSPNIARSDNNGSTFTATSPAAGYPTALAIAPSASNLVFAGMRDTSNSNSIGIWRSLNSGASWTQYNSGLPPQLPNITAFSVDSLSTSKVHAGTAAGDYVSTDGGLTWAVGPSGGGSLFANALAETSTRRLIATTANAIRILPLDSAPTISSLNVTSGSVGGGTAVRVNGTGFKPTIGLRVFFGNIDGVPDPLASSATSILVTTPSHAVGTVDVIVSNPDGQTAVLTNGFTFTNGAGANMTLNALASAGQVSLAWTPVSGATQYQIYRGVGGILGPLTTTTSASYTDSSVSNATGYLYQVTVSAGASGSSNVDLAVPMAYTRPTLSANGIIYAADWAETRAAVNAGRTAANLGAMPFTDPTLTGGVRIKRVHLIEIRTRVDEVRAAIGLPPLSYTDSTITAGSTKVKPAHLNEPRAGLN